MTQRLEQWLEVLSGEGINLTSAEIADACWLALIQQRFGVEQPGAAQETESASSAGQGQALPGSESIELGDVPNPPERSTPERPPAQPTGGLFPREGTNTVQPETKKLRVPGAPALRDPLSLAKALRPLMQQRPIGQGNQLDEPATLKRIAEERVWWPVTQPLSENWLELALVVDESTSMLMWQRTIEDLNRFFKHYGVFRDVRLWGLVAREGTNKAGAEDVAQSEIFVRNNPFSRLMPQDLRKPECLVDVAGRRLILILTDCVDAVWQTPQLLSVLKGWGESNPMAIVQMMPEWLWWRTNLRQTKLVSLQGKAAGSPNQRLEVVLADAAYRRKSVAEKRADIKVPIITLESDRVHIWTQMLADEGTYPAPGVIFNPRAQVMTVVAQQRRQQKAVTTGTASLKAQTFRGGASPIARRLGSLLAASPAITLPIIRMVQETLLPQSEQVHVAEVLLGGILQPKEETALGTRPDDVCYEFVDEEIRSDLLAEAPVKDTTAVLSYYIQENFNKSLNEFVLALRRLMSDGMSSEDELKPIATITAEVLQYRGAEYAEFVSEVQSRYGSDNLDDDQTPPIVNFPDLESFNFVDAQLVDEDDVSNFLPPLQTEEFTVVTFSDELSDGFTLFDFTVVTLQRRSRLFRKDAWDIQRSRQQAYRLIEALPDGCVLEMVSMPAGTFAMGSPDSEPERSRAESPQHEVRLDSFLLGRYPVTQAQWRAVASLPQVERSLKTAPSRFKGELRPVEQVSWYDAVEFCARLSAHTGREYRLPTEAEWEYACRAGTTTPFHFGDMITTEVANYDGSAYADGPTGEERGETTSVDHFEIANAFGLSDMHGNVREWCADHWHGDYEGAPTDGSAWLTDNEKAGRVWRGGSWIDVPRICRSAYRSDFTPEDRYNDLGFRVSCAAPRTP